MEREEYQGYTIESEARGEGVHWLGVRGPGGDFFEFSVHIAPPNPYDDSPGVDRSAFAATYGRRWVIGMLDLGRYQTGRVYREIRAPEWNPVFDQHDFPDDDLRVELLVALKRMPDAQARTERRLEIDFEGVALILNLDIARVLAVLKALVDEGSAERAEAGDGVTHRITSAGRARLDRVAPDR